MTIVEFERLLVEYWAGATGLEVDKTIFRGPLNASVINAVGVIIGESAGSGSYAAIPVYNVQILGRYKKRDDALSLSVKIDKALPHFSENFNIIKVGSTGVYPTSHKGKDVHGISVNLQVRTQKVS